MVRDRLVREPLAGENRHAPLARGQRIVICARKLEQHESRTFVNRPADHVRTVFVSFEQRPEIGGRFLE